MNSNSMVRHLAHMKQKNISDSSCRSIIVDTLFASGAPLSSKNLMMEIHSLFGVLVTRERLQEVLEYLKNTRVVQISSNGYVELASTKKAELLAARSEEIVSQNQAIRSWLDYLRSNKDLSPELEQQLAFALPVFLRKLFIRHGVSSYELLTTATNDFSLDIKEIAEEVALSYGDQSNNNSIADLLPSVFQLVSNNQINSYLIRCVKKAVGYISEVISEDSYSLLSSSLENLTIYLDTNVLYRLLHLQGDARYESIKETLEFCKRNKVKLRVSAATKKEFSARLRFDARVLKQYPVKTNLVSAGYAYRSSDNYVSAYWAQAQTTGISVDDYIQYYQNFDVLLEAEGITTETIVINEEALLDTAKEYYSKLSIRDKYHRKADATLWHDAYSLAYIQRMQKVDAQNAIDTGCLFLTTDQTIISLQREDYELREVPVIAIVPSQLLQMFAFTRAEDDYEETFVKFFASSTIGVSFDYSNGDIQEILSRISHYNGTNSEIAKKILSRELLNSRYRITNSDEEREEIIYQSISEELLNDLNVSKELIATLSANDQQQSHELTIAKNIIEQNQKQFGEEIEKLQAKCEASNQKELEESIARKEAEDETDRVKKRSKAQEGLYLAQKMKWWKTSRILCFIVGISLSLCIIGVSVFFGTNKDSGYFGLLALLALSGPITGFGIGAFSPSIRSKHYEALKQEYERKIESTIIMKY